MKKKFFFSSLATLTVFALLAGVISYATKAKEPQEKVEIAAEKNTNETPTPTEKAKKKNCSCCNDRAAKVKEQIRNARERRMAARRKAAREFVSQQKTEKHR